MSWLTNIKGTLSQTFRIKTGSGTGVLLKDESGVLGIKTATDSAYADAKLDSLEAADLKVTAGAASGSLLVSDAVGVLTYATPSSLGINANAELTKKQNFTQATTSPTTIFTPPANAVIHRVALKMNTPAGGTGASATVGISGTPARDFGTGDGDLQDSDAMLAFPLTKVGGSPGAIILTIVVGSQTFDGDFYITYSVPS